jgi:ornithine cyclodeaminase
VALLLLDRDVERLEDVAAAMGAVEVALRDRARGVAVVSPRLSVAPPDGDGVVVSAGSYAGVGAYGLRAYPVRADDRIDVVAVWNAEPPMLEAIVAGRVLGPLRVGAIGAVAMRLLAPPDASVVAVIGAGPQARMQAHAVCAVRDVREIRVFRRDPEGRTRAAAAWSRELAVAVRATRDAEEAVRGADVVVTATVAIEPVIHAGWLKPTALVSVLGRTATDGSEVGLDLFEQAALVVSDFPEQYERQSFLLSGTPHAAGILDLAELLVEGVTRPPGLAVFLSNGLSGTEVAVARELARRAAGLGLGLELDLRSARG